MAPAWAGVRGRARVPAGAGGDGGNSDRIGWPWPGGLGLFKVGVVGVSTAWRQDGFRLAPE